MSEQNPKPLTEFDRQCIQAFQMWDSLGRPEDPKVAAQALDIPRHTFSNRLLKFFLRDLGSNLPVSVLPGHEVRKHSTVLDGDGKVKLESIQTGLARSDEPFELPEGHRIKGISALVGGDGTVLQQWTKTEVVKGTDHEAVLESIKMAAEQAATRNLTDEAIKAMSVRYGDLESEINPDLLNFHALPDLHLGLYVWGQHCGISWDLKTAIDTLKATMLDLMQRAPAAKKGIILGGGDLIHADDDTKQTRRSGHVLDVDGRYPKVLMEAELLMVYQVELALQKYEEVEVRILPGNHDDDSSVAIPHFLWAWFRDEPRVKIDTSPDAFWFYEWGNVMLAATHGHETKIEKMPGVMAADRPEVWGRTKHRFAHGFHIHHKTKGGDEADGAEWETHRTPIPRDAFAHNHGYRAARSMQVISYDRRSGEEGRTVKLL